MNFVNALTDILYDLFRTFYLSGNEYVGLLLQRVLYISQYLGFPLTFFSDDVAQGHE